MGDRQTTTIQRLLDRLHAARDRRDASPRFSDPWYDADREMHAIERAIFRAPIEPASEAPATTDRQPMASIQPWAGAPDEWRAEPRFERERAG